MGCGCGSAAGAAKQTYTVVLADGSKKVYKSQIEANAAVARNTGARLAK